jgi:SAM-dependent methyltransferase
MPGEGSKPLTTEEVNQQYYDEFFNDNTVDYLARSAGSRWFDDLLRMILDNVDPARVASVADVGCGVGHKTAVLRRHFRDAEVSGFDFSAPAIAVAQRGFGPEGIAFSCEDITKTEYTKTYDLIAAFEVLEHVEDWKELLGSLIRVNDRYLLLSFPVGRMRAYEKDIGHVRNFQRGEMEAHLASNGYDTRTTFYAGFPFYSPVMRDLTQVFSKNYSEVSNAPMGFLSRRVHDVWYLLFRYLSRKHRGDAFIGLFERRSTAQRLDREVEPGRADDQGPGDQSDGGEG